jgi:hypothetical protein
MKITSTIINRNRYHLQIDLRLFHTILHSNRRTQAKKKHLRRSHLSHFNILTVIENSIFQELSITVYMMKLNPNITTSAKVAISSSAALTGPSK